MLANEEAVGFVGQWTESQVRLAELAYVLRLAELP